MTAKTRVVLMTGATDGIGKETAFQLARKGYRVLIHGRNPKRVNKTVLEIQNRTYREHAKGYIADFSSLHAVEEMATEIISTEPNLDVLINNAGIIMRSFQLSADGYEMTFAVNHLAHFYLTGRLMFLLNGSQQGRIINLTSGIHSRSIDLNGILLPEKFESVNAYSWSKLCNVLFTYKLSENNTGIKLTVNCLHPGVINTKMLTETWGFIGSPVSEGVKNELYLAISPEVENITGKHFEDCRTVRSSPISYNTDVQNQLWELSIKLIEEAGMQNPFPDWFHSSGKPEKY